ncbi:MAG: hypothetical protein H0V44_16865 [Planctomycetes bacterium]|nr:hypothetical protein [Planctomycetota bacterium]
MSKPPASAMIRAWAQADEPKIFGRSELEGVVIKILEGPAEGESGSQRYLIMENKKERTAVTTIRVTADSGSSVVYQMALMDTVQAFRPPRVGQLDQVEVTAVRWCG